MNQLTKAGAKIHHYSRWFNGVTCEMDDETLEKVKGFKFVTGVEITRDDTQPAEMPRRALPAVRQEPPVTQDQLALLNLWELHNAGFEGQGILMTFCDGGFQNAQEMDCFRQKELELGHFDFTDDVDGFYGETGAHGTECLSTVSAITDEYYGAATKAQYYLMRSEEHVTESPKEMDNMVAALEKSDSLGVNIFSVSLGYYYFNNSEWNLPTSSMDGRSTRASRAATIAARKGMLVCVAAGNEGNKEWHTICVPADADSILTVGAVNTEGALGAFSSYGPSADGRVKPEVCAVGVSTSLMSPYGFAIYSNGTSFATPQIAGLAACLWSALPDENAMQIRERIIRSADRYDQPELGQYGYGIPDAWKAYTMELPMGIESIQKSDISIQKIFKNGQLYILNNGKIYDVLGRKIGD